MNWRWLDQSALLLLHQESLVEHGGAAGIRDAGLFESALARPVNLALYEDPDFAELAAAYGFGLAKNHPFVDGNKRAAFLGIGMFLYLNGWRLNASQLDATQTVLKVAAGEIDELALADWIRGHSERR